MFDAMVSGEVTLPSDSFTSLQNRGEMGGGGFEIPTEGGGQCCLLNYEYE